MQSLFQKSTSEEHNAAIWWWWNGLRSNFLVSQMCGSAAWSEHSSHCRVKEFRRHVILCYTVLNAGQSWWILPCSNGNT